MTEFPATETIVTGCSNCPLLTSLMTYDFCQHPNAPKDSKVIETEAKETTPHWCPLKNGGGLLLTHKEIPKQQKNKKIKA